MQEDVYKTERMTSTVRTLRPTVQLANSELLAVANSGNVLLSERREDRELADESNRLSYRCNTWFFAVSSGLTVVVRSMTVMMMVVVVHAVVHDGNLLHLLWCWWLQLGLRLCLQLW